MVYGGGTRDLEARKETGETELWKSKSENKSPDGEWMRSPKAFEKS